MARAHHTDMEHRNCFLPYSSDVAVMNEREHLRGISPRNVSIAFQALLEHHLITLKGGNQTQNHGKNHPKSHTHDHKINVITVQGYFVNIP